MPLCVHNMFAINLYYGKIIIRKSSKYIIISYKINNQLIKRKEKKNTNSQSCKNPTVKGHGQLESQLLSGQGVN